MCIERTKGDKGGLGMWGGGSNLFYFGHEATAHEIDFGYCTSRQQTLINDGSQGKGQG